MRKTLVSIALIVAILVVVVAVAGSIVLGKSEPPRVDTPPPAIVVGVELVQRRDIVERVYGFGQM